MPRAMFVSLNVTYPQLSPLGRAQDAAALRNCTCVSWQVAAGANGVEFLFGVEHGHVVSAYRVPHPLQEWPRIPPLALGAGRRCVPVDEVPTADWDTALKWTRVPMGRCAFRYGDVRLDNEGRLSGFSFANPETDEELAEDGGA